MTPVVICMSGHKVWPKNRLPRMVLSLCKRGPNTGRCMLTQRNYNGMVKLVGH